MSFNSNSFDNCTISLLTCFPPEYATLLAKHVGISLIYKIYRLSIFIYFVFFKVLTWQFCNLDSISIFCQRLASPA